MHDFKKAKKQTLKKWQEILHGLLPLSKTGFCVWVGSSIACGFCREWGTTKPCFLSQKPNPNNCPAFGICTKALKRESEIREIHQWRKAAKELCRWVLEEVGKLEE